MQSEMISDVERWWYFCSTNYNLGKSTHKFYLSLSYICAFCLCFAERGGRNEMKLENIKLVRGRRKKNDFQYSRLDIVYGAPRLHLKQFGACRNGRSHNSFISKWNSTILLSLLESIAFCCYLAQVGTATTSGIWISFVIRVLPLGVKKGNEGRRQHRHRYWKGTPCRWMQIIFYYSNEDGYWGSLLSFFFFLLY